MSDKKSMEARIRILFPNGLLASTPTSSFLHHLSEDEIVGLGASILLALGKDSGDQDDVLRGPILAFTHGGATFVQKLSDWIKGKTPMVPPPEPKPEEPTPPVPLEVQFSEFRTDTLNALVRLEASLRELTELIREQDTPPEVSEARGHEEP